MLKANAWHHRSDALSSVVVIAGIFGSLNGYHSLDSIAAIVLYAI
jgi:divalent metal cation (Fe/Co/Zn/Cd) transporter